MSPTALKPKPRFTNTANSSSGPNKPSPCSHKQAQETQEKGFTICVFCAFLWPMETLIKDIRFGVRSLVKRPGFTALAIITLALGIGASTAIFSVVDGVLLRSLPYP